MSYGLSSLSMVMVAVGTFIAGRYVFQDGFANAGWSWGKPKHYLAVVGLVVLVWVVPSILELAFGMHSLPAGVIATEVLAVFVLRFVATLIPAFGEEFGWRGYMLPRLARRYSVRWALLLHAFIWWAWHLPTLVGFGARTEGAAGPVLGVAVVLLISIIPSMMHAVIYAYIWSSSQSLAVATVYHSAFDETRDALETSVGFGPFVDVIWQNVVLTLVGALLLWKGNWKNLSRRSSTRVQLQTGTYLKNQETS
jgi:membrane protease YdiL (CAAX protease family)